jgi:hypothetical protein
MEIHISWDGPIKFSDIKQLNKTDYDYGLYQVYGFHPLYGNDVLLYIGKAEKQTFFDRIKQETWNEHADSKNINIYLGRLIGDEKSITIENWEYKINLAEKLLIYTHGPAYNSSNLNQIPEKEILDIIVFNWGNHRQLFPEVSGSRWSSRYDHLSNEQYYSMKRLKE